MITVTDPRGNRETFIELEHVEAGTKRSIRKAWFELADDLKDRAIQEIRRKPKSGRTYVVRVRGGRRRRHVASAPGETHADLTGALRRSISWQVRGYETMEFGYGIRGSAPPWAPFVELGTRNMEPRPSLENAIDSTQANAEQHWQEAMFSEFNR